MQSLIGLNFHPPQMFIDNQNQEKKYSMVISSIGPTSNRDKSIIIIGIEPNMVSELEMACLANYILLIQFEASLLIVNFWTRKDPIWWERVPRSEKESDV